ncbi:MAG: thermonuclease family protein [Planctomycetota bacterium]
MPRRSRKLKPATTPGKDLRLWSPKAWALRSRRKRWAWGIAIVVVGLLLSRADRGGLGLAAPNDLARYDGVTAKVVRVVDGDTLLVDIPDLREDAPETRVRLWGIDAPELAKPSRNQPAEPGAQAATDALQALTEGQVVTLVLEPHRPRGDFGRVVAHVRLADGRQAAAVLLERGLARSDGRWSHARIDSYARLERTAREARVGIWDR